MLVESPLRAEAENKNDEHQKEESKILIKEEL